LESLRNTGRQKVDILIHSSLEIFLPGTLAKPAIGRLVYNKNVHCLFYRSIKILLPATTAERCTNAHF